MDRLNELVKKNPDFGRLRDVSCQLMLADRQQEELFNYVTGFVYNFLHESGPYFKYTADGAVPTFIRDISRYGYSPVIKQVYPCQGTSIVSLGVSSGVADSVPDLFVLGEYRKLREKLGDSCLFFGFVSDVLFDGDISLKIGGGAAEIYHISQFIKPYSWFGDFMNYKGLFQKLTDTSPIVTDEGLIRASLFNSEFYQNLAAMRRLRGLDGSGSGALEIGALSHSGFSFNFVGLAVQFGGETGPAPVVVPLNLGGSETPASGGLLDNLLPGKGLGGGNDIIDNEADTGGITPAQDPNKGTILP